MLSTWFNLYFVKEAVQAMFFRHEKSSTKHNSFSIIIISCFQTKEFTAVELMELYSVRWPLTSSYDSINPFFFSTRVIWNPTCQ